MLNTSLRGANPKQLRWQHKSISIDYVGAGSRWLLGKFCLEIASDSSACAAQLGAERLNCCALLWQRRQPDRWRCYAFVNGAIRMERNAEESHSDQRRLRRGI